MEGDCMVQVGGEEGFMWAMLKRMAIISNFSRGLADTPVI